MRVLLLCLLSLAMMCFAQEPASPSAAKIFAWFDRLGFEDLSKAKFARIWTGKWTEVGDTNRLEQDVCNGFILADSGGTFRAVLADLTVSVLEKHGTDPSQRDFCGYREQSLEQEAERLLTALKNAKHFELEQEKDNESHFDYFDRLPAPAQAFVIARVCAQQGLSELGLRLANALAQHSASGGLNHQPLAEWLEDELAYPMLWRGWIAFRDPACSWSDLRAMFQRILDECPRSHWKEHAEKHVKEITALLDADKARQPLAPDHPEELTWRIHEEVDGFIVEEAEIADYWPRPYPFKPRGSAGVITALRAKGNAAVPALLAELHRPPRPSRSASRYIRMGGGVSVQNTHALALSVLEDIAGFQFRLLVGANPIGAFPERDIAKDWWLAVQRGEERAWLLQHARAGDQQAQAVADCLHARYPVDAFEAATGAIRLAIKPSGASLQQALLDRLLDLKDPRTAAFLLEQFQESRTVRETIAFATAHRQLGRPEAERSILNAFREFTRADFEKGQDSLANQSSEPGENPQLAALRFLLGSRSSEPFRAIMEKWPEFPSSLRAIVAEQLALRITRHALRLSPAIVAM